MKSIIISTVGLSILLVAACKKDDDRNNEVAIPTFDFAQTVTFEQSLSAYNIFDGTPSNLTPTTDFHLLELSSVLFSDHSQKQRLVKVPAGSQMTSYSNGAVDYPNGTILTKTFFYYVDERDTSLGKRIIETRLLIKESDTWNVATYLWNQAQTDANLTTSGYDTPVSWISDEGNSLSTTYHVPTQNECMTCHQSNETLTPLGPTLRNLNRVVERNGSSLNQISHLQSIGVLNAFPASELSQMIDYNDLGASLSERGRAYLAMNCAHCHNPHGWDTPAEVGFDFRYEIPLNQTGISGEKDRIINSVSDGEMPFIGTTMMDHEGVDLIIEYLESL